MPLTNPHTRYGSSVHIKPKIGVDLDGVVFAFDLGACLALKLHGEPIEVRESTRWDEIKEYVSADSWQWLWNEGVRDAFNFAPTYPGVPAALREIQTMMDMVIITHRPRNVIDITLRRLAELRLQPVAVHHIQGQDKSLISPDCVAYIDDKPSNVTALAGAHDVPVFMPRKPWNAELHLVGSGMVMGNETRPFDIRPYDNFNEVTEWVRAQHKNRKTS
jgi:hypothetical protein